MTLAHLHLLLNHVPTIGTAIAIALLILTLVRKHDALRRVSLELFCMIALFTIPAYLSGVGTEVRLREMADISPILVNRHHDAAVQSSMLMLLTGTFAWFGLWQFRRAGRQTAFNTGAVLLLAVATMGLMARAAAMGGEIRHPEIIAELIAEGEVPVDETGAPIDVAAEPEPQDVTGEPAAEAEPGSDPEPAAIPDPGMFTAAGIAKVVNERVWLWPAMETLHFIGLWLLFGVVLLVHLRMLGLMSQTSFASLHRLLPWAALGLLLNTVTGMGFIIANPADYMSWPFYTKIGLLVLAGISLVYFTVFDGPWSVGSGDKVPMRVQAMAASTIVLWIGVMYFGRMLPFLGMAF